MNEYAIIVQNDESQWDDVKGDLYHYPNRYKDILSKGCKIIYYKGTLNNKIYKRLRLSDTPHYFGTGTIGDSIRDPESTRKNYYCEILDYLEFKKAVPFKMDGEYLETIPESRKSNYWRDGVRVINAETYEKILSYANRRSPVRILPRASEELESYRVVEGTKKVRFSAYYERNPIYRTQALNIHGYTCQACDFNFQATYGALGKDYIHVHHNKPISETGPTRIEPAKDLSVLCPNCHAMIHRDKKNTLTLEELKAILDANST